MLDILGNNLTASLHKYYLVLSRRDKRLLLIIIDIFLFSVALYSAFWLKFSSEDSIPEIWKYSGQIFLLISIKLLIFNLRGIYTPVLRYTGLEFVSTAAQAVLYSSGILVVLAYLQGFWPLPRSILITDALLTLMLAIGARLLIRYVGQRLSDNSPLGKKSPERLIIYGAGITGTQIARALSGDRSYRLIAFVDDERDLQRQIIQGLRVYSSKDLPRLFQHNPFDTVLLAMPSIERVRKRQIIEKLQSLPVLVKTIPTLREILSGKVSINEIRNVDVTDLLGREEIEPDRNLLTMNVTGKSVLVTGAGGSIGSELCRQIAKLDPRCLILYEIGEYALYSIDTELAETYPYLTRIAYLGSVTDREYFESILKKHRVDTIYHAAAYKHVPLVEINPAQGVFNNVAGTLTAARCAIATNVSHFVLISTDKAVRPTNVMGATKRVAELLVQGLADRPEILTRFAIVRFGNVLDSSGSVVPRFRKQIAQGKPLTVTHREITRYFMSIPEAVRLVIQAGAMAEGGEVFLLDMGDPIRIYDLAVQMIRLSGLVPEKDIPIQITGLRPGEKLYEELLLNATNIKSTRHRKIFSAYEKKISWDILYPNVQSLLATARLNDRDAIVEQLKTIVTEYTPQRQPQRSTLRVVKSTSSQFRRPYEEQIHFQP
ncbi:MAG: nucleoside-diphosphate sugar epimerase/dehydratase [Prochloraceae cyanobacterium]|nr:nucleoside-diphosphate sugar epimerase/dehydratase [Prochloraceae cyanobacterium]